MARYSKIERVILNDAKFNQLSDDAQLVFFRLLVHPQLSALGTLRISLGGLAGEMYWAFSRFSEALAEITAQGMVQVDEEVHVLWFPNFLKYNPPGSPNVVKSWGEIGDRLPEGRLKERLKVKVRIFIRTFPIAFQAALPTIFLPTSLSQNPKEKN